ncbi:MAG: hypothetical protein KKA61_00020 [Nanoarchaeota archaeon]|nr:hypothetical protein [Nanoarchaeota archaeon]
MAKIVNEKGNYKILAERIEKINVSYNPDPYDGYSQESKTKINEMREKARDDPSLFDGPGVRLSAYSFDNGKLSLDLQHTTYFCHVATRKNINDKKDCAKWFGCSGITLSKHGKEYLIWVGEKSPLNEIGSGQIQLLPAGNINPISDFGLGYSVKRELYEEALKKKPLYRALKGNFEIELLGIKKRNLKLAGSAKRHPLDLNCRIELCEPYMLMDMLEISSFNLAHLIYLDMEKKEIVDSFKQIPDNEKEFSNILPLEFKKNYLEDYFKSKFDNLRPLLRAAIDSLLGNYDYLLEKLEK